ncbi:MULTISPECIES: (Fe-S)-binding protein [unclassified Enterococcus]|uniref:(Fe-S)-binding protein n=1 Tax=unclassified Enterococcus TaxID=2608891 RepID=UPI001556A151|nr:MULTISPECIES: (Fe-S)-binding protein [unclassified Enterococcus]MBS7576043.1 (Fe-S)-binding protein [Enterococcus sp. MMGLQ5-2]MBS7583276.1 (Fe-S)-binding protein [Enterococcus sp. MMGLQ5-1]NPD11136.1 (Fe-S)-binding protein [Enterococcus sp. MMGLQ5-1]NPD35879.1 (Fe-S)-binding protein [Enterococcus sp. MMGLQ5-2]
MKVAIYTTCVVDLLFPNVGQAAVAVLERLGVTVVVPDKQVCCGQPTYNSGYFKESWSVIHNEIDAFMEYYPDVDFVVGLAGSCTAMFKEFPRIIAEGDPQKADYLSKAIQLADKTYEFTQFLVNVLGIVDLGATLKGTATYHRSCHMTRLLGEHHSPFVLINHVKDLEYRQIPHIENCCGFGGTFSVKEPFISEMMVNEKMNDVLSTDADILISADMGCLMNIGGKFNREGHPIKIMHIAEVLNSNVDINRIKMPDLDEILAVKKHDEVTA